MTSNTIYKSPAVSCLTCRKELSAKGIFSHFLYTHGTEEEKLKMSSGRLLGLSIGKQTQLRNAKINLAKAETEYYKLPNYCKYCKNILKYKNKFQIFCNHSCHARYENEHRSPETLLKLSNSLKGKTYPSRKGIKLNKPPYTKIPKIYFTLQMCTCCGITFRNMKQRKTCSPECQRKNSTYRKIVHEYIHNGEILKLESSWEVDIAKWLDIHKIEWTRPKHIVWYDTNGKLRRYFPDFYLPNYDVYLDPKNDYQINISTEKLEKISQQVILIYGSVAHIIDKIAFLPQR